MSKSRIIVSLISQYDNSPYALHELDPPTLAQVNERSICHISLFVFSRRKSP